MEYFFGCAGVGEGGEKRRKGYRAERKRRKRDGEKDSGVWRREGEERGKGG